MTEFNFTCNKAAKALGKDARTVQKKIDAAKLSPVGKSRGYPVYFIGDVAAAVFATESSGVAYEVDKLDPKSRAEHFMAEKRELEVLEKRRELIPYDEASEKYAELARSFAKFFDTFIDDLEQTQLFTVEQLEKMQELNDDQRIVFCNSEF